MIPIFFISLFGVDKESAVKIIKEFMKEMSNDTRVIDYDDKVALTDSEAKLVIEHSANIRNSFELQLMGKEERDKCLSKIKENPGLTTRQITRLTGVSQSVIARA